MNYNIDQLRKQLLDYYGTAICSGFPMAIMDASKIECMRDEEIIEEADKLGLID